MLEPLRVWTALQLCRRPTPIRNADFTLKQEGTEGIMLCGVVQLKLLEGLMQISYEETTPAPDLSDRDRGFPSTSCVDQEEGLK